jgi:mRNA interferase MazF
MAIREHPIQGCVVTVDYSTGGFRTPEMTKRRLAVVVSPKISARPGLCTVVPLSTTAPQPKMPYHASIRIPFELPVAWGDMERWVKGDMVNAVGFHRVDLLRLAKSADGRRKYQMTPLPTELFKQVQVCALHGMGLPKLTRHL